MSPHEEFLELCAASTAGELTQEERRKLDDHLLGCAACREVLKQLQETVKTAVPAIAAGLPQDDPQPDKSWSQDKAEAALFERLSKEDSQAGSRQTQKFQKDVINDTESSNRRAHFPSRFGSGQLWMTYAAAVLLFLALAISAYRVGVRKGVEVATNVPATRGQGKDSLEAQLSDLSHDRDTLRAQLAARDKAIDDLKQQVERLKAAENDRVGQSAASQKEQESRRVEQEASANAHLADLQKRLDAEERARSEESSRAATLEAKLGEVTQELRERDQTVAAQSPATAKPRRDHRATADSACRTERTAGSRPGHSGIDGGAGAVRCRGYRRRKGRGNQEILRAHFLHKREVSDFLRLRSRPAARCQERKHIPGLGPARARPRAGFETGCSLRRQRFEEAVDPEIRRPTEARADRRRFRDRGTEWRQPQAQQ